MNEKQAAHLRSALEHVTEHPREWIQNHYLARTSCGTMACLAGRIVLEAGAPYQEVDWVPVRDYDGDLNELVPVPGMATATVIDVDGFPTFVSEIAADRIGVPYRQAEHLFAASNSLRTLWELAAEYSGGLIEVPEDLPEWADLRVIDVDFPHDVFSHDVPTSHVGAYLDQVERGVRE